VCNESKKINKTNELFVFAIFKKGRESKYLLCRGNNFHKRVEGRHAFLIGLSFFLKKAK